MHGLIADLRYGSRMLLRRPGSSALAVLALALGIGLTATMFSIVNGAILRGLPFDESDRLLHLARLNPSQSDDDFDVSPHDYVDWRDRQRSFTALSAFHQWAVVITSAGGTERYRGLRMTANTLGILREKVARGRDFTSADEQPGAPPVAIISHRVWEAQFRSDPAVVGQVLRVNGAPTEIVGVMPPGFAFPVLQDVWLPFQITLPAKRGDGVSSEVLGRLKAGVTAREARAEMEAIAAQLAAQYPENRNITVEAKGYIEEFIGGEVIATLYTMLGAVFGVLLIACANVTNLQLARALERTREIAIRTAIGAGRWRIVRQLLIEGLLISLAGAVLGLAITQAGVTLFNRAIVDTNPPFWIDIRIDAAVLAFAAALAVAAGLLSCILPALRVTRGGTGEALKDHGRGATSARTGLLARALVGTAVTLSCALLLVSGLMIRSVVEIGRITYAYSTSDVLIGRTTLDEPRYSTDALVADVADRIRTRLAAVPGARGAAIATGEPGSGGSYYLTKEGQTFERPEDQPAVRRIAATPEYFGVVRLRAAAGRLFNGGDRAGGLPVAVITRDLADKYFPGEDPIGRRIRLGRNPDFPWWTIVGIVPTLASASGSGDLGETAFVPFAQAPDRNLTLLLSAGETPIALGPAVRAAVRAVDQDLPVFGLDSLAAVIYRRAWPFRVFGTLFMTFGLSALIMAAAGLYGVLAYGVRLRTQEIGVRMALGADRGRVIRMVLRQGLLVVAVGLVAGLGIGFLLGPLMQALFFNVAATDPVVFAATTGLLLLTGVLASSIPARRAASVDPLVALREG